MTETVCAEQARSLTDFKSRDAHILQQQREYQPLVVASHRRRIQTARSICDPQRIRGRKSHVRQRNCSSYRENGQARWYSSLALKSWPTDRLDLLGQRSPQRPMSLRVQVKSIGFIALAHRTRVEEVHAEGIGHDLELQCQLP